MSDNGTPIREHASGKDDTISLAKMPPPTDSRARHDSDDSILGRGRRIPKESATEPVKQPEKVRKKPGPKPWSTKPITKNDMVAKKALIKEIESYWGKGFIKNFIPKCHRPLVKRGKTKRSSLRAPENDPKKWMPSVLKAVLMIAKKTDDKVWLKDQMRDVVTYRIKNTGNRKPQLVTTDFDVIEDIFDKGWDVATSFGIRYKHLLQNRADHEETDEDIAHIFGEVPEDGDDGEEDEDGEDSENGEVDEDPSEKDSGQVLSSGYFQMSGYGQEAEYTPSRQQHHQRQQGYGQPASRRQPPRQQARGYDQPPPARHFFPPAHYGTPGFPMNQQITPSPSYAESEDRPRSSMSNKRARDQSPSYGQQKRGRQSILDTPSQQASRHHMQLPPSRPHPGIPKIKDEPDVEPSSAFRESFDMPDDELGPGDDYMDDELMRLEIEAAEATQRAAQLKFKFAERQRRKKMGTSMDNPMSLE